MNANQSERKAKAAALRLLAAAERSLLAARELERAHRELLAAVKPDAGDGPALAILRKEEIDD